MRADRYRGCRRRGGGVTGVNGTRRRDKQKIIVIALPSGETAACARTPRRPRLRSLDGQAGAILCSLRTPASEFFISPSVRKQMFAVRGECRREREKSPRCR